jgi:hypothetical protein
MLTDLTLFRGTLILKGRVVTGGPCCWKGVSYPMLINLTLLRGGEDTCVSTPPSRRSTMK